jgi:hypothetical protein
METKKNIEADILSVIRDLERPPPPANQKEILDTKTLKQSTQDQLDFVSAIEKANLTHLLDGLCPGKSITDIKAELVKALSDLDEIDKMLCE